jgi:hypothetical protein
LKHFLFRLQPAFGVANSVLDLAAGFVAVEAENVRLHQQLADAQSAADRAEAAKKTAADASAKVKELEKELAKLKKNLKDEQKLKELAAKEKQEVATLAE